MGFYSRFRRFSRKLSSQYPLRVSLSSTVLGGLTWYKIEVTDKDRGKLYSVIVFSVESLSARKRNIVSFAVSVLEDFNGVVVGVTRSLVLLVFKSFRCSKSVKSNVVYLSKFLGV
jgi:hypothetical protein